MAGALILIEGYGLYCKKHDRPFVFYTFQLRDDKRKVGTVIAAPRFFFTFLSMILGLLTDVQTFTTMILDKT